MLNLWHLTLNYKYILYVQGVRGKHECDKERNGRYLKRPKSKLCRWKMNWMALRLTVDLTWQEEKISEFEDFSRNFQKWDTKTKRMEKINSKLQDNIQQANMCNWSYKRWGEAIRDKKKKILKETMAENFLYSTKYFLNICCVPGAGNMMVRSTNTFPELKAGGKINDIKRFGKCHLAFVYGWLLPSTWTILWCWLLWHHPFWVLVSP